jgi:hypothetical protein
MSSGYSHGDPESRVKCPYCGEECLADFVDIGVGMIQCGPYWCTACHASEIGPHDEIRPITEIEIETGWYAPGAPAGSSANTDDSGRIIRHFEADTLYRKKQGAAPRYSKSGKRLITKD